LIKIDLPSPQTYMVQERSMPEAGWRVHILTRIAPVHAEVAQAVFIVASLLALAMLFFLLWNQRRKRSKERLRYQLETQRNREINEANTRLIQEIDERKRAEEALVQARDELIQATKLAALGEMSTGISHELNQPLAAIRAYADNARALIDHGRNEDALANLIQISDLTERMAQISSQLKIFARKGVSQSVSVSLDASIKNSLRILQPRIKEENVTIHLCPAAHEVFVLANSVQLEQVLVNLIGNALHAVEESEQQHIEISTEVCDQEVVLKIWDNGPGIEQDQLSMIFDPFFTTKKEGRGLGLGLSISHRLMDGMNGKLQAENHPEGGAVFTLRLPVAEDT
jgi:two-component system, NtrC family, C4-dicarboxylate transport sensor histidine kinase DctB